MLQAKRSFRTGRLIDFKNYLPTVYDNYPHIKDKISYEDFLKLDRKKGGDKGYHLNGYKLSYADRLIFVEYIYEKEAYLILLGDQALVYNHNYKDNALFKDGYLNTWFENNQEALHELIKKTNKEATSSTLDINLDLIPKGVSYEGDYVVLSQQQQTILQKLFFPFIIAGVPGSGKTLEALEILRELNLKESQKDNPGTILFVMFSKDLADHFGQYQDELPHVDIKFYNELFAESNLTLVTATYFLEWIELYFENNKNKFKVPSNNKSKQNRTPAFITDFKNNPQKLYQLFRLISGFDSLKECNQFNALKLQGSDEEQKFIFETLQTYRLHLKDKSFADSALSSLPESIKTYNYTLSDESQDLTYHQMRELSRITLRKNIGFFIDDLQSLFDRYSKITALAKDLNIKTSDILTLNGSYRCPKPIAHFLSTILQVHYSLNDPLNKFEGYRFSSNIADENFEPVSWLSDLSELPKDFLKPHPDVAFIANDEDEAASFKKQYPTLAVFTIKEIKGLQYPYIILLHPLSDAELKNAHVQFDEKNIKDQVYLAKGNAQHDTTLFWSKLYTKGSRASCKLFVVQAPCIESQKIIDYVQTKSKEFKYDDDNNNPTSKSETTAPLLSPISDKKWLNEAERLITAGLLIQAKVAFLQIPSNNDETFNAFVFHIQSVLSKSKQATQERKNQASLNQNFSAAAVAISKKNYKKLKELLLKNPLLITAPLVTGNATLLFTAAHCGDPEIIKLLLESGADLDHRNTKGLNALHYALKAHNHHAIKILLDAYEKKNLKEKINEIAGGERSLETVVNHGNIALFERLLNYPFDSHALVHDLFLGQKIIDSGNLTMLEKLLEKDKSILNARDDEGTTLLHQAIIKIKEEIFEFLLKEGADPYVLDNNNRNILMYSIHFPSLKTITALKNRFEKDGKLHNMLHTEDNFKSTIASFLQKLPKKEIPPEVISILMPSLKDLFHQAIEAIQQKNIPGLKTLLSKHKDLAIIVNHEGETLLFKAIRVGDAESVRLLLQSGSNLTQENIRNCNALHLVLKMPDVNLEILYLILEQYKNRMMTHFVNETINDERAIDIAVKKDIGIFKILLKYEFNVNDLTQDKTLLMRVFSEEHRTSLTKVFMQWLQNEPISLKELCPIKNSKGENARHFAIRNNHYFELDVLKENGAVLIDETDLIFATRSSCRLDTIMALHESNKNGIDIVDNNKMTALHHAAANNLTNIFAYLLEQGASSDIEDNKNYIPLHWAIMNESLGVLNFVLSIADLLSQKQLNALLHFATEKGKFNIVNLFLGNKADASITVGSGNLLYHAIMSGNVSTVVSFTVHYKKNNKLQEKLNEKVNGKSIIDLGILDEPKNTGIKNILIPKKIEDPIKPNTSTKKNTNELSTPEHVSTSQQYTKQFEFLKIKLTPNTTNINVSAETRFQLQLLEGKQPDYLIKSYNDAIQAIKNNNYEEVVKSLEYAPELIYTTNNNNESLLHHAGLFGRKDMITLLLNKGFNIAHKNKQGMNTLEMTITKHTIESELVNILLDAHEKTGTTAEINDITFYGSRLIDLAASLNNEKMFKRLLEYPLKMHAIHPTSKVNLLTTLIFKRNHAMLNYFISHAFTSKATTINDLKEVLASIDQAILLSCKDENHNNLLTCAIISGRIEVVTLVAEHVNELGLLQKMMENKNKDDLSVMNISFTSDKNIREYLVQLQKKIKHHKPSFFLPKDLNEPEKIFNNTTMEQSN